jgi:hypothetical protein
MVCIDFTPDGRASASGGAIQAQSFDAYSVIFDAENGYSSIPICVVANSLALASFCRLEIFEIRL